MSNHKFVYLAFGLAVAGAASAARADDTLNIKIGVAAPHSKGFVRLGEDIDNGARLAIEELNAQAITIGDKRAVFEIVSVDDGADPKMAASVAQSLVSQHVNGVVGHLNSAATIAAAPIYRDAGIPELSPAAANPKFTHLGYETAFRVIANENQLAYAMAGYAIAYHSITQYAIVRDRTPYGDGVAASFAAYGAQTGVQQVDSESFSHSSPNFQALAESLTAHQPQAIFFGGMDDDAAHLYAALKRAGSKAILVGSDGICTPEFGRYEPDALRGESDRVFCGESGGTTADRRPKAAKFVQDYVAHFGHPPIVFAPQAYDAVMTLADAMKRAGSADPHVYLAQLKTARYDGVSNEISFDSHGDLHIAVATVYTYNNGVKTLVPVVAPSPLDTQ